LTAGSGNPFSLASFTLGMINVFLETSKVSWSNVVEIGPTLLSTTVKVFFMEVTFAFRTLTSSLGVTVIFAVTLIPNRCAREPSERRARNNFDEAP